MKNIYLAVVSVCVFQAVLGQGTQLRSDTIKSAGTFTWVAPCDVTEITVEAWGAGAGSSRASGGGGGGGAYAKSVLTVNPGERYQLNIGKGGKVTDPGGNTIFGSNLVKAEGGGQSGSVNDRHQGGRVTQSSGNIVKYSGGDGGTGAGAGGGSSAGNSQNGNTGTANGQGGQAPNGGGAGGDGGGNGSTPGGGGGNGGLGSDGQIVISFNSNMSSYCIPHLINGGQVRPITYIELNGKSNSVNQNIEYENFCDPIFDGNKGEDYQITVKGDVRANKVAYVTVFIDWNQDGNFDGANERIDIGENSQVPYNSIQTYINTIRIPDSAKSGTTKLRVVFMENGYSLVACEDINNSFKFGQAEDYIININASQPDIPDQKDTICSGETFIILPEDADAKTTYSWSQPVPISGISGLASGSGAASISGTLINSTDEPVNVVYEVTPSVDGASGSAFMVTVTVNPPSGTWRGFSSDWNDNANWWCGIKPTASTDVFIPATGKQSPYYFPVINSSGGDVHNLDIATGATVTLTSGAQFNISGAVSGGGLINAASGAVQFNGTAAQSVSGDMFTDTTISSLIVSNDAGLSVVKAAHELAVTDKITFGSDEGKLNSNGNITLKSTYDRTASLGEVGEHNVVTGEFTVERYINSGIGGDKHGKKWMFLATPAQGQTISESWMEGKNNSISGYGIYLTGPGGTGAGWDDESPAPAIKEYDPETNLWKGATTSNIGLYNPGGWMTFVRGDRSVKAIDQDANTTTLRSKGTLITGDKTFTVPKDPTDTKFFSIGNPYASAVDMRLVLTDPTASFTLWNPNLDNPEYGLGNYVTYTRAGADFDVIPPIGASNNFLLSGQAFFVQRDKTSDQTITFTESTKGFTNTNAAFFRPMGVKDDVVPALRANLYSSSDLIDGTLQLFSDEYNNALDGQDARKMLNSGINLSIKVEDRLLIVERRKMFTDGDTVHFNLTGTTNGSYRFDFDAKNMAVPGLEGWLEDRFTDERTPLNPEGVTNVPFEITSATASRAAGRFLLVFMRPAASPLPVTFVSLNAVKDGSQVNVAWKVAQEAGLSRYVVMKSTDGTNFTDMTDISATGADDYTVVDKHPVDGYNYYRVRSIGIDGQASYSEIVKVFVGSMEPSLRVFPNPVTNNTIQLQLRNYPAGVYEIRLLNPAGQLMLSRQFTHAGGNYTEKIPWDHKLARGNYQLEVTRPDGSKKMIVVMY